jgi:uncharacterized protein
VIDVSNSTILIGLAKIGKLDLLRRVFSKIFIPQEVYIELVEKGKRKPGAEKIKNARWIEPKSVKDRTQVNLLLTSLEKGEAEVLCLAKELKAGLVLLEKRKPGRALSWPASQ